VAGEVHDVNTAPSSAHSNVAPTWLDEKVKLALVLSVAGSGPERIVVSGGARTVQL
jgi:hypothetical protein